MIAQKWHRKKDEKKKRKKNEKKRVMLQGQPGAGEVRRSAAAQGSLIIAEQSLRTKPYKKKNTESGCMRVSVRE